MASKSRECHDIGFGISFLPWKKALILLDEYDTPLQEAYANGYWEALTQFIRSLFNSAFKNNPYMEQGLMAGITLVSKESIFSMMFEDMVKDWFSSENIHPALRICF